MNTSASCKQLNEGIVSAKKENVNNTLVKILGWNATVLHGDPSSFDRWIWLKRHLLPGPLRTLDAGSGSGAYTMYAAKIGNQALGISSDERNNQVAQMRADMLGLDSAKFITADLRNLDHDPSKLGTFDQIICLETIEHILNDKKLMKDLASLLKAGGRLLLTAPYKNHKPLLYEQLSSSEDGGHVRWGYAHEEIRELFTNCGLEVIREEYVSGFVTQKLMDLMRILSRVHEKLAWAIIFPLRALLVIDKPLTDLIGYPYLSIGVVGIKR